MRPVTAVNQRTKLQDLHHEWPRSLPTITNNVLLNNRSFLVHKIDSIITDRGTKDILLPDAEIEDNSIVVPEVLPIEGIAQFSAPDNAKCAKVGEFVSLFNYFPLFCLVDH
ncbi:hypothetical protein B5X24_HaOG203929 [Helicoverpa armigera]|uniref:Uncharacterized protein n=1 Tax=Helicoverpa armigera TaxID=29058 RepID=A0A2W1BPK2_HELAM|nr:hypothetical protein B5X24_HaOG203929 [Helicoverpa armigera]